MTEESERGEGVRNRLRLSPEQRSHGGTDDPPKDREPAIVTFTPNKPTRNFAIERETRSSTGLKERHAAGQRKKVLRPALLTFERCAAAQLKYKRFQRAGQSGYP